jgi:hypothetical protein
VAENLSLGRAAERLADKGEGLQIVLRGLVELDMGDNAITKLLDVEELRGRGRHDGVGKAQERGCSDQY